MQGLGTAREGVVKIGRATRSAEEEGSRGPEAGLMKDHFTCLLKEPRVKTGATLGDSHSEQEPNRGEMRAVLSIYDTAMGGDGGFV